jgi:hypothetical protein
MLLVDDETPQSVYALAHSAVAAVPPEIGWLRALAGQADGISCFATAIDGASGEYFLVSIYYDRPNSFNVARVSESSIGFPEVEGLTVGGGAVYASSFDEATSTTTLLTVDPQTGVATAVGRTSSDVRIVGLSADYDYGWTFGLYGVSRPHGTNPVPRVYAIDTKTGAETPLVDLPSPCERLGLGNRGLVAAGANGYWIEPGSFRVDPLDPWFLDSPGPVTIVGASDHVWMSPIVPSSWGVVKDRYRPR